MLTAWRLSRALGGQLVTHEGGEFWALFDNDFKAALDGHGRVARPALTCRRDDVAACARAHVPRVAGTAYKV
jgi:hypothetical protein